MKILVTGGAGFIGRWIVKKLLPNHSVKVIDDLSNGSIENIEEFRNMENFTFVQGDILDKKNLSQNFDVDLCIHLAAKVNVQESLDNPIYYYDNNLTGTINILEACRQENVRLVYCSTCMVYDVTRTVPIMETDPLNPRSPYAGSKLAGEMMVLSYHHGYGLPVIIVRPFNTYGPFQKRNVEGGVVNIFIQNYLNDHDLQIFGNGEQTRDLLFVEDCADFFKIIVETNKGNGEIFNIGTGVDINIKDLALLINKNPGRIKYIPHPHPQSEIRKLVCDYTKANKIFGWYPKNTFHEGLIKTIEWTKSVRVAQ